MTERSTSPFTSVPRGIEIARYFWEVTPRRNPSADGIDLFRGPRGSGDYCYLWVTTMVDLDMWNAFLLDVRTHVDVPPGEMGETRDYLYLFAGAGERFDVQWHNQPIAFGAPTSVHRDRFNTGMDWFTNLIEKSIEDTDEALLAGMESRLLTRLASEEEKLKEPPPFPEVSEETRAWIKYEVEEALQRRLWSENARAFGFDPDERKEGNDG